MAFNLLKRRKHSQSTPRVPDGLRVYAIGDVHGRADLLDALAGQVAADLQAANYDQAKTIFLGDYIDRGLDSAGVVARLSRGEFPTPLVALRGNHEQMLLNFLEDETVLAAWRQFGGLETLHSFGVNVTDVMRGHGFLKAQAELRAVLPLPDLAFIKATRHYCGIGDYFFCHAGVRPGVPLDRQSEEDLLWIREIFLDSGEDFGKIVVHGHTPVQAPDIRHNQINIDTGAFATNKLTCLILQGTDRRIIST